MGSQDPLLASLSGQGWTIVLIWALAAALAAGSLAARPEDPRKREEACTELTNATVTITPVVPQFVPGCVVVENHGQVTWENDDRVAHDPGDGREDRSDIALCFQSAVDIEDEDSLPAGHTYSIQLGFEASTETLVLEKAWHNGERQDLNGDDPGLGTIECHEAAWERIDDDTIAVDYLCHIHPDEPGRILLDI